MLSLLQALKPETYVKAFELLHDVGQVESLLSLATLYLSILIRNQVYLLKLQV